jgi:hypothetical protein
MSSAVPTLTALASIAISLGWRNRRWLRGPPTDWNAVRESFGYEAQPDRPVREVKPPRRWRTWRERLTGRIDFDAERRFLGYGVTLEGEYEPAERSLLSKQG